MQLERLGQVAITVRNLPESVAYYRDALGLRLLFETPDLAFFDCGGTRLLLGAENAAGQAVLLYFFVADIRGAHEELRRRGVAFEQAPHLVARLPDREVWLATFRDPSGNLHNLMSETATPPARGAAGDS